MDGHRSDLRWKMAAISLGIAHLEMSEEGYGAGAPKERYVNLGNFLR